MNAPERMARPLSEVDPQIYQAIQEQNKAAIQSSPMGIAKMKPVMPEQKTGTDD